ncbi:MAG: tRNA (adenosine(37)-N6)-threonylcarbamoyltransferase complex dimerization subunit type 1 TsaB [Candidatus Ureaplasma intestinipullorum]|uniref:tRNA (Adenosine(37)-N6)-threonylcarbamoyltransferase complex dimerization subunit type 1 TsaB n=1 Tax=Candidatus Ureaplasma intestinipullorum TaxID=2838770 RepID=A0A9E2KX42_9BACT|nr:tRNA (adenosine(37)-N6)-threonylcarbamoyltransferase complex dimerization subunit type 1 TsaB [Candidatus Ureaplasma intestinipullorum]
MEKYSLMIDVCTNDCAFVIFNNKKCEKIFYHTNKNLIDVMNDILNDLIKKVNIKYSDIDKIYLIYGPGSFTGVRAGLNLAKTIISIYPNIKLFIIDSLLAMNCGNGVAILDAKGNKSYINISINNKIVQPTIMIDNDNLEEYLQKYQELPIFDADKLTIEDKINNLLKNLNLFTIVDDWLSLEPNYIKEPV